MLSSDKPVKGNSEDLKNRIRKLRQSKSRFETPSSVQGLGTTWWNFATDSWSGVEIQDDIESYQDLG